MVVMFRAGQLGNQLFQYCAIKATFPQQGILLIGMDELLASFDCADILNGRLIGRILARTLANIGYSSAINFVQKTRLVRLGSEVRTNVGAFVSLTPGRLNCITLLKEGFYQCPKIVSRSDVPRIKQDVIDAAAKFLSGSTPRDRPLYFLHQRRGDYLTWPSREAPAALDQYWYEEQIRKLKYVNPDAHFVVISDDPNHAENLYSKRRDFTVSSQSAYVDMGIMSLCSGGGILSASSFSWWGAFFAQERFANAAFVAPKYWLGRGSNAWYPPCIQTSWISYA